MFDRLKLYLQTSYEKLKFRILPYFFSQNSGFFRKFYNTIIFSFKGLFSRIYSSVGNNLKKSTYSLSSSILKCILVCLIAGGPVLLLYSRYVKTFTLSYSVFHNQNLRQIGQGVHELRSDKQIYQDIY